MIFIFIIYILPFFSLFRSQGNKDGKANEVNVKHIEDLSEKIRSLSQNKVCLLISKLSFKLM